MGTIVFRAGGKYLGSKNLLLSMLMMVIWVACPHALKAQETDSSDIWSGPDITSVPLIMETYLEEIPDSDNDYVRPSVDVCHEWFLLFPTCATVTLGEPTTLDGSRYCAYIENKYDLCVYLVDLWDNCDTEKDGGPKLDPLRVVFSKVDCVEVPLAPSPPPYCEDRVGQIMPVIEAVTPPLDVVTSFYNPYIMVREKNDPDNFVVLNGILAEAGTLSTSSVQMQVYAQVEENRVCAYRQSPQPERVGCIDRPGFMPNPVITEIPGVSHASPRFQIELEGDPNRQRIEIGASECKPLYGVDFCAVRFSAENKLCVFGNENTGNNLVVAYIHDANGNSPGPVIEPFDPNNPQHQILYGAPNATMEVRPNTPLEQGYCVDIPPAISCQATYNSAVSATVENGVYVGTVGIEGEITITNATGQICMSPGDCYEDGDWQTQQGRTTWLDYKIGNGAWVHPTLGQVSGGTVTVGSGTQSGDLYIRVNEQPGGYGNNSGSYSAQVSVVASYPNSESCPSGTTQVN